jgi:glyoxalase family protein
MQTGPILSGLHHVTAVTGNAPGNLDFYTRILGMRLVKKTVNQDDVTAYHLFYADAIGSPGTDLTFFDWSQSPSARPGAGTISGTSLRVTGGEASLALWSDWFDKNEVRHEPVEVQDGYPTLSFQDPEGQRLRLVAEPEPKAPVRFHPWAKSPVPLKAAIVGLSDVTLSVTDTDSSALLLTEVLGFRASADYPGIFDVGAGGPGARLRLATSNGHGYAGAGGVHHVAWRVADPQELQAWKERLRHYSIASSGLVDRFYFQSLYFRIPGGILFELATEGPGFTADGETLEDLGERLSLPPFLESSRARIEAGLKPL